MKKPSRTAQSTRNAKRIDLPKTADGKCDFDGCVVAALSVALVCLCLSFPASAHNQNPAVSVCHEDSGNPHHCHIATKRKDGHEAATSLGVLLGMFVVLYVAHHMNVPIYGIDGNVPEGNANKGSELSGRAPASRAPSLHLDLGEIRSFDEPRPALELRFRF